MNFLVDYNLQKYAAILLGKIANDGWLDLIPLSFIFFQDIELPTDSNDRVVWQLAQQNRVILLTANRNMKGEDSLEQVIREDNTPDSLPVITIGNLDRFSKEASYRSRCADRIIEIVLDIENYIGVGRIFIP
ncbi:ACP S-malonyltransferase [Nostoc sp. JL33]|uniref:ACP S-malonyltransferase n=1 Tax=Nostoc sp. JL33 TaxID=2815396 RepID=UPI0025D571BA|nr:ACP S-malonyltransferase [Nostoc sp. JL33]MBN3873282.1 ACP S-malonyltransferase [Nostoc sp. JL33]